MKHIFDPHFKYKPSFDTDISERFERIRKAMKKEHERTAEAAEAAQKQADAIAAEAERVVAKKKIGGKA